MISVIKKYIFFVPAYSNCLEDVFENHHLVRKSPFIKIFIIEAFDHDFTIYIPYNAPN